MAFLEWRKFSFFELKKNVDDGRLIELFKESSISVTTSGNNHLILGDTFGQIHIISRPWQIHTFRAFEVNVCLAQQMRNSPYLVAIGEDDAGVCSILRVWDTSRRDKNNQPICTRATRVNAKNMKPTVLCVHENMKLMAIGFADGTLLLYRGDISRERGSRSKTLREASSSVTGLAFKTTANTTLLYVATENSIYIYNVTQKDKEVMSLLDNNGCALNCSVLAESFKESHFMVARNDAIYCYTSDGKGPCYAVDGEKVMLQWFRSYVIIVSKSTRLTPTQTAQGAPASQTKRSNLITLLDIQNKFIVFQTSFAEIRSILNEWGGFYIIDGHNSIFHLNEKDLQSKLGSLFKKNLYDIAIRIAKSQQYDSDSLIDLFRQYGDHLYSKMDYAGSVEQYVKTIGKLEPSYVIRQFMDSKHIDKLTCYLEALHKKGFASEDHTTLLLNCFTKLNKTDELKEFVLQTDKELNFDVNIAIKVCRQSKPDEALMMAKKYDKDDWYIKLQLEDHKRFTDVIEYIAKLPFCIAQTYMKKYGTMLIEHAGDEATQLLKTLCTDFAPKNNSNKQRSDADEYIHLFLSDSAHLVEFLDHLIQEGCTLSSAVYDTLLENYLHVWQAKSGFDRQKVGQTIVKLLQNPDVLYDKHQALVVCHLHGFSEGLLYLYEEQKLYQQILRHHIASNDTAAVLACCRRFGHQDPTLWVQALWSCVRVTNYRYDGLLPEVLSVIASERLLSAQLVIEAIGTGKAETTLSQIKEYVSMELRKEHEMIASDREFACKYRRDTDELKRKLELLKNGPIVIQGSRCAACHHPLELPSLHFLCQHSYHQHCFQSYAENENECLACQPANKNVIELVRTRECDKAPHESFHALLDAATDGFTLVAEYARRGVFNTVKVITGKPASKNVIKESLPANTASEGWIRAQENKRSTPIVPISEARMRTQENRFSSSLEANISNHPRGGLKERAQAKNNPFESEDAYDESKDPFSDHQRNVGKSNESLEEDVDDDYDRNLNPFT